MGFISGMQFEFRRTSGKHKYWNTSVIAAKVEPGALELFPRGLQRADQADTKGTWSSREGAARCHRDGRGLPHCW